MSAASDLGAKAKKSQRLFFALWPSATAQRAMAQYARELAQQTRGRVCREHTLHVTLAFLGEVLDDQFPSVLRAGAATPANAFDVCFDLLGYWRRNRIGWLAPSDAAASIALSDALQTSLRKEGIAFDEKPFTPHITLVRNAHVGVELQRVRPVCWRVSELRLMRSTLQASGALYETVGCWALN